MHGAAGGPPGGHEKRSGGLKWTCTRWFGQEASSPLTTVESRLNWPLCGSRRFPLCSIDPKNRTRCGLPECRPLTMPQPPNVQMLRTWKSKRGANASCGKVRELGADELQAASDMTVSPTSLVDFAAPIAGKGDPYRAGLAQGLDRLIYQLVRGRESHAAQAFTWIGAALI